MNLEERRRCLEAMTALAHREAENAAGIERVFLPLPAHRLALRPEIVVVCGSRGAGKSAFFKLLGELRTTDRIRAYLDDPRIPEATWMEAFAQSMHHPSEAILDTFAEGRGEDALRAFWMAHLLLRIAEERPGLVEPPADLQAMWTSHRGDPERWVPLAQERLGAVATGLDQVERELGKRGQMVFATYDHLDRIGTFNPLIRRRYVASLLALWLSLSNRYQKLRAKIFLREDLLDAAGLAFTDASKLRARSVSLDWDIESLYRVTVRQMAGSSPDLRAWLDEINHGLVLEAKPPVGWMPGPMPEPVQKAFADRVAGEVMGAGVTKGYTYRWIPNHLRDGQGRIVPRSVLVLFGYAAKEALQHPLESGPQLLAPRDLSVAMNETSKDRVGEISEEYTPAMRLKQLAGMVLPIPPEQVIARVGEPVEGEPPGLTRDGRAVLDELVRLGVVTIRSDGRVDMPDIYRFQFGVLRKGVVTRPR
ncbi:MAG: hypothetical protein ABJE95_30215 [Byssovorax sp.]